MFAGLRTWVWCLFFVFSLAFEAIFGGVIRALHDVDTYGRVFQLFFVMRTF